MRFPLRFWNSLGGILSAGVAMLVILYPEKISDALAIAILALGNAVIVTLITLVSEDAVTPMADPHLPIGSSVTVTTAEGQPIMVRKVQ